MDQELYKYQIAVWIDGNDNPKSIFERGHWQEMARCQTKSRAEEVAICLSLRHPDGVQVAELVRDASGGRSWQGYLSYPPEARTKA